MKSAILLFTTLRMVIVANAVGIVTAAEPARQPRVPAGRMKAAVTEITSTRDPASAPTSALSDGIASPAPGAAWYTAVAGGDYFEDGGTPPVFHLDLGTDHDMGGIAFTNYATNDNRVIAFAMRYATEAETTSRFGASIPDATFALSRTKSDLVGVKHAIAAGESQSISYSRPIKARYVELTLTDNCGGNRVGFIDIEFISEVPPPPWKPRRAEFVLEPEVIIPSTKEWRYWAARPLSSCVRVGYS